MTDFLAKYRESKFPNPKEDFADYILNQLSEQIYQEWKDKGIYSYVATSHGHGDDIMTLSLNIMSAGDKNQYFYRLIEIEQHIDRAYKVNIRAFQNPPTAWKEISSASELKTELIEIMGDPRIKIIVEMVRQMGETIRAWEKESSTKLSDKLDDGISNKDNLADV